jgi:hypothetical protein
MRYLFLSWLLSCVFIKLHAQQPAPAELDSAATQKELFPVKRTRPPGSATEAIPANTATPAQSAAKIPPAELNGYFVLFNKQRKKSKEGVFKKNRLIDGCNYIYDDKGVLKKIQVYRQGNYVSDSLFAQ